MLIITNILVPSRLCHVNHTNKQCPNSTSGSVTILDAMKWSMVSSMRDALLGYHRSGASSHPSNHRSKPYPRVQIQSSPPSLCCHRTFFNGLFQGHGGSQQRNGRLTITEQPGSFLWVWTTQAILPTGVYEEHLSVTCPPLRTIW